MASPLNDKAAEMIAAISAGDVAAVARSVANGCSVEAPLNAMRARALHMATDQPEVLVALLDVHKADVNSRRGDGSTPVCDAAISGNVEGLKVLLARGANADIPDDDGDGPLYYAETGDKPKHTECARLLREHGASGVTSSGVLHTGLHGSSGTLPVGFRSVKHQRCFGCNELPGPGANLSKCSACHTAFYCSRECQKTDWPNHKAQCKATRTSAK